MRPTRLAFVVACALSAAACTSTQQVSAAKGQLQSTARAIIGTSLIGARGATPSDQEKIDDSVAGICASRTWTPEECAAHDRATSQPR